MTENDELANQHEAPPENKVDLTVKRRRLSLSSLATVRSLLCVPGMRYRQLFLDQDLSLAVKRRYKLTSRKK